jgi:hypothetical protein
MLTARDAASAGAGAGGAGAGSGAMGTLAAVGASRRVSEP